MSRGIGDQGLDEVLDCRGHVRDIFMQATKSEVVSSGPVFQLINSGEGCVKLVL